MGPSLKKSSSSASRTEKHDSYSVFLRTIRIKGFGLDSAEVQLNRILLSQVKQESDKVTGLGTQYEILSNGPSGFVLAAALEIKQTVPDVDGDILSIACLFSALLECDAKAPIELRQRFAQNEAKVIFWPYMREFVSDTTMRMSIAPLILPLATSAELNSKAPKSSKKV